MQYLLLSVQRSRVKGTPSSLLKEASEAIVSPSLLRIEKSRSLVVVLPWLPVIPITADARRTRGRGDAQGLPEAQAHRPGEDVHQGSGGARQDLRPRQQQEHLERDRLLLRPEGALEGSRRDQSALDARPRATAVGPWTGWPEPQAGGLRCPRRAKLPLRPDLPGEPHTSTRR